MGLNTVPGGMCEMSCNYHFDSGEVHSRTVCVYIYKQDEAEGGVYCVPMCYVIQDGMLLYVILRTYLRSTSLSLSRFLPRF
jgi:hypothetical protein